MVFKAIPRQKVTIQKEEILNFFKLALQGKLIKGGCVEKFEYKFAAYTGTKYALAVASGRLGLQLILGSLDLKEGDEVLIPAYTFYIVPEVVKRAGFNPVFVDINEEDFNIDPGCTEKKITKRTKAIIATHLFGKPCQLNKILEIAKKHNLFVIEDCAQAIGAEHCNKKVGSFGDCAYFSFETVKPFHTFGGGMITTNNYLLYKEIKKKIDVYDYPKRTKLVKKVAFTIIESLLTSAFFFTICIYPLLLFANFLGKDLIAFAKKAKGRFKLLETRYANFQASVGLIKLDRLGRQLQMRAIKAKSLIEKLNSNVYTKNSPPNINHIFYYFTIISANGRRFSKILLRKGIDTATHVAQDCSRSISCSAEFPIARKVSEGIVQIPIYHQMSKKDINRIANVLNRYFK